MIHLENNNFKWLVTGAAGFIGSNLTEFLLKNNQTVIAIDNYVTGHPHNIESLLKDLNKEQVDRFTFIEGDIKDLQFCMKASEGCDFILHQAAIGSVPRSIENPLLSHENNINGFLNMLIAAKEKNVKNFVYAASSSTYGDSETLPKVENKIGKPLSPYAVTKYVNELYADVFHRVYNINVIGLRYFNVFGRRQDPNGSYAAVIPKWINAMQKNEDVSINGDGSTSRDFCYIDNVIEANILAALANFDKQHNKVYNVAYGASTTLNELFELIKLNLSSHQIHYSKDVAYLPFREGDILHSLADISKATKEINYNPRFSLSDGLKETVTWFIENNK